MWFKTDDGILVNLSLWECVGVKPCQGGAFVLMAWSGGDDDYHEVTLSSPFASYADALGWLDTQVAPALTAPLRACRKFRFRFHR
jgi:hypothetical protein